MFKSNHISFQMNDQYFFFQQSCWKSLNASRLICMHRLSVKKHFIYDNMYFSLYFFFWHNYSLRLKFIIIRKQNLLPWTFSLTDIHYMYLWSQNTCAVLEGDHGGLIIQQNIERASWWLFIVTVHNIQTIGIKW